MPEDNYYITRFNVTQLNEIALSAILISTIVTREDQFDCQMNPDV